MDDKLTKQISDLRDELLQLAITRDTFVTDMNRKEGEATESIRREYAQIRKIDRRKYLKRANELREQIDNMGVTA